MLNSNVKATTIVATIVVMSLLLVGCTVTFPAPGEAMPAAGEEVSVAAPITEVEAAAPAAESAPAAEGATELAGTGPDYPMTLTDGWQQVESGEYHWYAFTYDSDEDYDDIDIRIYTDPADGAILTIRNEDQANKWRNDGIHEHVGCCTVENLGDEDEDKDPYASWLGTLASGNYYLVVGHAENLVEPVSYRIEFVNAEGVSMHEGAEAPSAAAPQAEPAAAAAPAAESAPAAEGATELAGTGPDYPMTLTDGWQQVESGEYHWYAFTYDSDEDYDDIDIRIYTDPADGAILTIRNEDQANKWRDDGIHEHVGCCTVENLGDEDEDKDSFASWLGTLASGNYFLVVGHAENLVEPVSYRIEFVNAEGVSMHEGAEAPSAAVPQAEPAAAAQPAAAPEAATMPGTDGSGPDNAIAPTGEWMVLGEGQRHWYAFGYDSDEDYEDIEIRVYSDPVDSAILTIHNEDQANQWRADGTLEHLGCCTVENLGDEDKDENPYASWSGTLGSGSYYIVVSNAENFEGTANYRFEFANVQGVSFP